MTKYLFGRSILSYRLGPSVVRTCFLRTTAVSHDGAVERLCNGASTDGRKTNNKMGVGENQSRHLPQRGTHRGHVVALVLANSMAGQNGNRLSIVQHNQQLRKDRRRFGPAICGLLGVIEVRSSLPLVVPPAVGPPGVEYSTHSKPRR